MYHLILQNFSFKNLNLWLDVESRKNELELTIVWPKLHKVLWHKIDSNSRSQSFFKFLTIFFYKGHQKQESETRVHSVRRPYTRVNDSETRQVGLLSKTSETRKHRRSNQSRGYLGETTCILSCLLSEIDVGHRDSLWVSDLRDCKVSTSKSLRKIEKRSTVISRNERGRRGWVYNK